VYGLKLYKNDEYVKKIKELRSMECVWLETSYFFKDITITPKVGLVLCQDLVQVKMRNFSPF